MKQIIFTMIGAILFCGQLVGQVVSDDFNLDSNENNVFLKSSEKIKNFNYTVYDGGVKAPDSSLFVSSFNGASSLYVGLLKPVTELRIADKNKAPFKLVELNATCNNCDSFYEGEVTVVGLMKGSKVTNVVKVKMDKVFKPGGVYSFDQFPEFAEVDEVRVYGEKLSISLDRIVYEPAGIASPNFATTFTD